AGLAGATPICESRKVKIAMYTAISTRLLAIATLALALPAAGQTSPPETASETREETILAEREHKSQALTPDQPPSLEQKMLAIRENQLFGRMLGDSDGWRV